MSCLGAHTRRTGVVVPEANHEFLVLNDQVLLQFPHSVLISAHQRSLLFCQLWEIAEWRLRHCFLQLLFIILHITCADFNLLGPEVVGLNPFCQIVESALGYFSKLLIISIFNPVDSFDEIGARIELGLNFDQRSLNWILLFCSDPRNQNRFIHFQHLAFFWFFYAFDSKHLQYFLARRGQFLLSPSALTYCLVKLVILSLDLT